MARVVVTGMGIISALGIGVEENLTALRNDTSGLKKAKHFLSKYVQSHPFGEVDKPDIELAQILGLDPNKTYSRSDLLVIAACKEAIHQSGLTPDEVSSPKTALISASTVGGMCHTDALYNDASFPDNKPSKYLDTYSCSDHTNVITALFNIKGFTTTINTACSSSANAIMLGTRLIQSGRAKRVIVGGVDSLAKFTVNGFNALGILSKEPCLSFDAKRSGLTLGEGAAYLVLESEEVVGTKKQLALVTGYGNSNDSFHTTAISENATGPTISMNNALISAHLPSSSIDFINAHGTGTGNNDQTELQGFMNVFDRIPLYASTKTFTGHTLGAAGAIEAVYSIVSLLHQEVYSNLRVQDPIAPFLTLPNTTYKKNISLNHVLSNSFGFGGNCTSLIFSKA